MRPINFVIIFALCLALALFSLENTEFTTIQVIPGVEVQAPLAIELILAMGMGAVLAWLYSIWNRLLRQVESMRARRAERDKDQHIQTLEQDLESYKAEVEQQHQSLPPSESGTEKRSTEAITQ
ncbi:MAG: DUF1049 domain-containing protein [Cyanobacteria bacterium QS_4_48_99]|nr:MAG: DUF1049 domain-containing protein [Cyanobacteria bacterium QS_4_48_99]